MIKFENVSKLYGNSPALSNISFTLAAGSLNFITGHSGAGKSTLLRLIAGLDRPDSGEIQVGAHALAQLHDRDLPKLRRQMGIVFQDNQLLNDRSVFDNIALPLIISRRKKSDVIARVNAALQRVSLQHKSDEFPEALSGGEQQRVGIARAVVNQPRLLIADEPTGNLDPDMSHDIIKLFQRFNAAGVTVLIATHDMQLLNIRHHTRLELNGGRLSNPRRQRPQAQARKTTTGADAVANTREYARP